MFLIIWLFLREVGEAEDPSCNLEAARRNLLFKVAELEAKMEKVKKAEKLLSKKVKKALQNKKIDPFEHRQVKVLNTIF